MEPSHTSTGMVSPPGLDLDRLADYLDRTALGIIDGPFTAEVIAGGKSNLMFILRGAADRVVLRRPPLGHVLPTAHDMSREYKVIAALHPAGFPVPAPLHLCEDPDVIGAPFCLMSYVDGRTLLSLDALASLDRTAAARVGELLVDTLARLHAIVPAEVGLADLGRPEGYLERQVHRLYQQWERSKTRELPSVERLAVTLKTPSQRRHEPASCTGTTLRTTSSSTAT
jgi:aminoglycoside phosphotransferase (APT) family kinase protein